MQKILSAFFLLNVICSFNSLQASQKHHHHNENPPCNHESLQDARDAEHHGH